MNPAGVLLFRMRTHRRRWRLWRAFGVAGALWRCPEPLRQPNQCLPPHPSSFVFSGFECAKWQRLCRPSGNLLGMNPAGVLLFRMRAHRRRWRLWRAFGVAGGPRCCPEPLRQPNQCLPPHPSSFVFSGFEGAKRQRLCRPSGNLLGMNPAGVLLFRMRAHRRRWRLWRGLGVAGGPRYCPEPLRQPNQCLPPHPSSFVFSGFEGAKRQRLCRPSRNPLGMNPAGVLLFRMRAHRRRWRLWRAFGVAGAHGAAQSRYVNPTNACHPTHPAVFLAGSKVPNGALPTKWQPVGHESCWGSAVSHACSSATLAAVTCLWGPALFLAGSNVPNGSGSADQVATCWAWILLGFCCFACVLTGDAGGCDVPLEWLVAHGTAQSRYVNPTNACHPTHPALFLAGSKVPNGSGSTSASEPYRMLLWNHLLIWCWLRSQDWWLWCFRYIPHTFLTRNRESCEAPPRAMIPDLCAWLTFAQVYWEIRTKQTTHV